MFQTQLCDLLNLVGEAAGWRHRYLSRQSPTVWLRVGSCLTEGASAYRTSRTSSRVAPHRISTFLPFVRLMAAPRKAERGDAINLKPKSRRLEVKKEKKTKLVILRLQVDIILYTLYFTFKFSLEWFSKGSWLILDGLPSFRIIHGQMSSIENFVAPFITTECGWTRPIKALTAPKVNYE